MPDSKLVPERFNLAFYLVAYVDILDQSRRLRKFPKQNQLSADIHLHAKALKKTFGLVKALRNAFEDYYISFQRGPTPAVLDKIPVERREEFIKLSERKMKFQFFSDSLIIYVSLEKDGEMMLPINGVYLAMITCATMFSLFLAGGDPIRIGMDVGLGNDDYLNSFYGPALQSAYDLERKAQRPRIVIGHELIRYLESFEELPPNSPANQLSRATAEKCRGLIIEDTDKKFIIDHLGPQFRNAVSDPKLLPVSTAYQFVLKEITRFRKKTTGSRRKQNAELCRRYEEIKTYMDPRLSLWE